MADYSVTKHCRREDCHEWVVRDERTHTEVTTRIPHAEAFRVALGCAYQDNLDKMARLFGMIELEVPAVYQRHLKKWTISRLVQMRDGFRAPATMMPKIYDWPTDMTITKTPVSETGPTWQQLVAHREADVISKAQARQSMFGDAWEQVMKTATVEWPQDIDRRPAEPMDVAGYIAEATGAYPVLLGADAATAAEIMGYEMTETKFAEVSDLSDSGDELAGTQEPENSKVAPISAFSADFSILGFARRVLCKPFLPENR